MIHRNSFGRLSAGFLLILAGVGTITGRLFDGGKAERPEPLLLSQAMLQGSLAYPPLVSIQPLPEGPLCEWEPASGTTPLAALRQQSPMQSARTTSGQGSPDEVSRRKPLRMIRDSYASYSAVAVDAPRGEVVMTDENFFNILVYDRLSNTPASAAMTEPKRVIGGPKTNVEFQCGLYIDPQSGDIYAVNNDTVDTLAIFSRQAKGDVAPDRELATPHGTFGIAVDELRQELFLTVQHSSAVVVYHKTAQGKEAPLRVLQGERTGLADPHGIALDTQNGFMYVANHGSVHQVRPGGGTQDWGELQQNALPGTGKILPSSITVYSLTASGDTSPLRTITGPGTQLNWPSGVAVDPERGELFVANDAGDSILVFRTTASGNAAPLRVLQGPKTLIRNPTGIQLDLKNDELWVANFGNHTATVFKRTAAGDSSPLRVIRSAPPGTPALIISNPGAVAYDSKREQILAPN